MEDTFRLLNLSPDRKTQYLEQREKQYLERLMTANKGAKLSFEEKEYKRLEADDTRDKQEKPILKKSGYEMIFPMKHDREKMETYNAFLKMSKDIQDQFTHGKKNTKIAEANVYDLMVKISKEKKAAPRALLEPVRAADKQERAKTANDKKKMLEQKRLKEAEDNWVNATNMKLKQKKQLERERLVILDNIQAQKDEQRQKEKRQKANMIQQATWKLIESEKKSDRLHILTAQQEKASDLAQVAREKERMMQKSKEML